MDDLELMPPIPPAKDSKDIKFYKYDYDEAIFDKDELLAFIFGAVDEIWDIVKGVNIKTGQTHYYLQNNHTIYDPSLAVITKDDLYAYVFKPLEKIKNSDILDYIGKNNNLAQFYDMKASDFSINFINQLIKEFNENIQKQYVLDAETIKEIKEYITFDHFIRFRQVLSKQRKYYLQSNQIAVNPLIDESILTEIEKYADIIYDFMHQEYNRVEWDYHYNTIGNCYALSIMFNLFNKDFNLVQGGMPYKEWDEQRFYQHSWLESKDIIYDPAFRDLDFYDLND